MSKSDDYFGGSKKRKVESIDEDVEIKSDSSDASSSDKETAKSGNWDFLSNMLGLSGKKKEPSPAKPESTEKPESTQQKREPAATVKKQTKKHDSAKVEKGSKPRITEDLITEDPIKALEEVANAPAEDKADLLTQIFSAGFGDSKKEKPATNSSDSLVAKASDSDSDSGVDQPDAKKEPRSRGRSRRGSKKPQHEAADSIAEEVVEDVVAADDDFVEFEIEELDNTPVNDDEADTRGRSRRRRRGGGGGGDAEKSSRGGRKSPASESRRSKPKPEPEPEFEDESFDDPIESHDVDPRDVDPRDTDGDEGGRGRRPRGEQRSRGGRTSEGSRGPRS